MNGTVRYTRLGWSAVPGDGAGQCAVLEDCPRTVQTDDFARARFQLS